MPVVEWPCEACGARNPGGTNFCGQCGAAPGSRKPASRTPADQPDVTEALRSFVDAHVARRLIETGGRLTEERRLVTALFADISGFTPLADRLDPEALLEVIDPIITRLSNVVGRYEGYVEKFAGDALLAFFGAPVSHEDDAARALFVAGEMHRELEQVLKELPEGARDLVLHIGVNTGHVVARILGSQVRLDYAVLGDAVILAQRLQSVSPPRTTYVGESTYRLTENRFEFAAVGELTLKGKAKAVPAWRLVGPRATAPGDRQSAPLVGRYEELRAVTVALEALRGGTGSAVSVVGEAGVGKTRLTQTARKQAQAIGVRWLDARCVSYGAGLAYWPYADMLRGLVGISLNTPDTEALSRLQGVLRERGIDATLPYLGRLLGLPSPDTTGLEPEAFRRGLHGAVASVLRAHTGEAPVVLALEDVHWADASSLSLTKELATACLDSRLLLYLTGRQESGPAIDEVLSEVPDSSRRRIDLVPLPESAVAELLAGILKAPPAPTLTALLAERTGGNPFFLEEVVRSLQEGGALIQAGGAWETIKGWQAETVPPTIEGAVSARIDRLPQAQAAVLQTASVIGRRIRRPLLRALAPEAEGMEAALQALIERRFLDQPDQDGEFLLFHHALTQEVAYSRLLRRQRRELHRKVAQVAEDLYGAGDEWIDLLARHLYLGEAGAKAIDYLLRAAERAKRLFANEEAILHLRHAAELAQARAELHERIPTILLSLAQLQEHGGNYEEAFQLYSRVRDLAGNIEAWRGMASTLRRRGRYVETLALLDEAFASPSHPGGDLRPLHLERSWCLNAAGQLNEAIESAQVGLRSPSSKPDAITAYLLLQLTYAATMQGHFEDALRHGAEARLIFEEQENLSGLTTALRAVGSAYRRTGQLQEGVRTLERALLLAERVGSAEEIGGCLIAVGVMELEMGALDPAIAHTRRATEEFERAQHGAGRATAYGNLAEMLVHRGEYEEATDYCERTLRIAEEIGHTVTLASAHRTKGLISAHQGDLAQAYSQAQMAADLLLKMHAAPLAARALHMVGEALDIAGDGERAAALHQRARSLT